MIIFDLEWNRGYDTHALNEILQIGAVRVERLGGRIVDTLDLYIRPRIHKKLNKVSQDLPEIDRSLQSQMDFPMAMRQFLDWCGEDRVFGTWGLDDVQVLQQNCAYWGMHMPHMDRLHDLQAVFSTLLGVGHALALESAVQYCDVPTPFCYHNAHNDALYTAIVGEVMGDWALLLEPQAYGTIDKGARPPKKPSRRRKHMSKPEEPHGILRPEERQAMLAEFAPLQELPAPKKCGPMAASRDILNAYPARRTACPVCGKKRTVQSWYTQDWGRFYSTFHCNEHGKFLCRLRLYMERGSSKWMGRLEVLPPENKNLGFFEAALRFQPYRCKNPQPKAKKIAKPAQKSTAS